MADYEQLFQVCQVQYCQQCVNFQYVGYNTANDVLTFGGDSVTQLIVNGYHSLVTQHIHRPYQPKQSPSILSGLVFI